MADKTDAQGGEGKEVVTDMLLSLLHHWTIRGKTNTEILNIMDAKFSQEQMKTAHKKLGAAGQEYYKDRQGGKEGTGTQVQAIHLLKEVQKMNTAGTLPTLTVYSEDLRLMVGLLDPMGLRDEKSVAARLESMELGLRRMQDMIHQTSRQPQPPGRGAKQHGQQEGGKSRTSVPNVVLSSAPDPAAGAEATFATIAANGGRQGRQEDKQSKLAPSTERPVRTRTPSVKRDREEEGWTTAGKNGKGKKAVRKTMAGNSKADLTEIGEGAQAGSVQFYIGNTSPKSDKDLVVKTLNKCAAELQKGPLTVLKLDLLTTVENPRSKCWRIEVPFKDKELMENSELWPRGWKTRRFFGRIGGERTAEKKMRVNDDTADKIIADAEALKRQEAEEGTVPEK
jgi:hypothetical protein